MAFEKYQHAGLVNLGLCDGPKYHLTLVIESLRIECNVKATQSGYKFVRGYR